MGFENNYFFVDGSSLIADVTKLRSSKAAFGNRRLDLSKFALYFSVTTCRELHGNMFKRFVFYFASGDPRVPQIFLIPNLRSSGVMVDVSIQYCGKRLRKSALVEDWIRTKKPPGPVLDRLHRSEKAVDTQICCDAMQLVANGALDRLFLYTNDYDYVPLCRALKQQGANISLIRLHGVKLNKELRAECDSFNIVEKDDALQKMFE